MRSRNSASGDRSVRDQSRALRSRRPHQPRPTQQRMRESGAQYKRVDADADAQPGARTAAEKETTSSTSPTHGEGATGRQSPSSAAGNTVHAQRHRRSTGSEPRTHQTLSAFQLSSPSTTGMRGSQDSRTRSSAGGGRPNLIRRQDRHAEVAATVRSLQLLAR